MQQGPFARRVRQQSTTLGVRCAPPLLPPTPHPPFRTTPHPPLNTFHTLNPSGTSRTGRVEGPATEHDVESASSLSQESLEEEEEGEESHCMHMAPACQVSWCRGERARRRKEAEEEGWESRCMHMPSLVR